MVSWLAKPVRSVNNPAIYLGMARHLLYKMKMDRLINMVCCIGLITILVGCNKIDVPEPVKEDPVFYFNFNVDNSNANLAAGQANYFMDANYEINSNGILHLIGTLKPKDCRNLCPGSLRIVIRDIRKFDPDRFNITQTLRPKHYGYVWNLRRDSVVIHFKNNSRSETPFKSIWNLGNGLTVTQNHVTATYGRKAFRVALNVFNQAGCESVQVQSFDTENGYYCRSFIVPGESNNQRVLKVRSFGEAPFTYKWNNGSTDSLIMLNSITSTSLRRKYGVTVTDPNGCESVSGFDLTKANTDVNSLKDICVADFSSKLELVPNTTNALGTGLISIDFMNKDGVLFTSKNFRQPNDAFFEVLSVEDFEKNEKNQSVKKIGIRFSCNLHSPETDRDIMIRNAKGFMAVAYPD
jgi:hypothetical protein